MVIRVLTSEEYQRLVERLIGLGESVKGARYHSAGPEYTSLMICFLLHNMVSAKSLLRLCDSSGRGWFPPTVGYAIVRPMFEVDVTAHYITQSPIERSRQYIEFEGILRKQEMDAYSKHRNSDKPGWQEPLTLAWQQYWAPKQSEITSCYTAIRHNYEKINKKGKVLPNQNWSGKSIHQMAIEVDHEEAYDIFYAELSSFTHVDVRLANRFLRLGPDGLSWSVRPGEFDVANVFRHAATFLTCYLELFASQFDVWSKDDVETCWDFGHDLSVQP